MADIKQIKLPNNTTYNIVDTHKSGIYTVIGTQTASTGSWTGALHGVSALYAGLTIMYYLPWAGNGNATLNLTLDNGTTTGAKNCYYSTGRLTTHYGKGCNIVMTYWPAGTIKVDGTATTDDRWIANANYVDGNDISTNRPYYTRFTAGGEGIKQNSLILRSFYASIIDDTFTNDTDGSHYASLTSTSGTGTKTYASGLWDITGPFYYYGGADVAIGSLTGYNTINDCINLVDLRYTFNITTTTLTAGKPVYAIFTLRELEEEEFCSSYATLGATVSSTTYYYTQDPSSVSASESIVYKYIGVAYDGYRVDLSLHNPSYSFRYGQLQELNKVNNAKILDYMDDKISDWSINDYSGTDVSVSNNTDKTVLTATLDGKGLYLIMASVYFETNSTKSRWIYVTDESTSSTSAISYYARASCYASDASGTGLNVVFLYKATSNNKQLWLRAKQNSGSSLKTQPRLQYIRLRSY